MARKYSAGAEGVKLWFRLSGFFQGHEYLIRVAWVNVVMSPNKGTPI